jgi:hypothetical protein
VQAARPLCSAGRFQTPNKAVQRMAAVAAAPKNREHWAAAIAHRIH